MNIKKFSRTLPMKLWLLLLGVVLFSFFSNDFGLVDIQKTAIILAAGVDKTEDGFSVTAQIAVPKGSDRTTGGTSSVEIEAEGETVSDCVSLIFAKTGWVPKFVFCNLIVVGEEAAKSDMIGALNYFLRNDYMSDSCLLAVCEGKAGALLSSTSAIDDTSSLAIEKLFSNAAVNSGKVVPNSLKDFAISYYGVSESGYLPYVRASEQEGGQNDHAPTSAGAGTNAGGERDEPQKVYIAEETALFSKGKMVGLLPREQTLAFSLLTGKVSTGTFGAEDAGKPVTLTVVKNGGGVSLDLKDGPTAKLALSVTVRLCCRSITAPVEDIVSDSVPSPILKSAKAVLEEYAETLFSMCREAQCDLFQFKRMLYARSRKDYAAWKDSLLLALRPEIEAKVVSMK